MKHLAKIAGGLIAMLLLFGSVQAWAAGATQDREFNHMSTGFPLVGVHATTACEACHVGGVFVGTPRACDGCHATGKRIVATPKSTKHIVTDAPCETCHFNTSTFFGARYNHGTAVPGQCENCHNGRITQGKPTSHPVTTFACDNCHRSSSWLPASWNHRDTVSDCATCHSGGPGMAGRTYTTARHSGTYTTLTILTPCRECHTNYYSFFSYYYTHSGPGAVTACGNCHNNGLYANGVMQIATTAAHTNYATVGITQCTSCHRSKAPGTFPTGKYDHAGKTLATDCDTCHAGHGTTFTGVTQMITTAGNIHAAATTVGIIASGTATPGCDSCHSMTNYSVWTGVYRHGDTAYSTKMGTGSCAGCHAGTPASPTYPPIKPIPTNHTNAFTAGLVTLTSGAGSCSACHTTYTSWTQMNHGALTMAGGCKKCHDSGLNPGLYFANMEKKSNGHKGYSQATQDCISCHANQYNRWNHP